MEDVQPHERINFAGGSPWEPLRGFSRAVRIGNQLLISGTTAMNPRGEVMGNDAYEQTRAVIDRVRDILHANGFTIQDVVRTRMFVTNIAKWDEYARAHQEAFEKVRPASSIVQVERLVDPRLLVELEVDAVGGCSSVRNVQLPPWQGMTK